MKNSLITRYRALYLLGTLHCFWYNQVCRLEQDRPGLQRHRGGLPFSPQSGRTFLCGSPIHHGDPVCTGCRLIMNVDWNFVDALEIWAGTFNKRRPENTEALKALAETS